MQDTTFVVDIDVSNTGRIYVLESGTPKIEVYDLDGQFQFMFGSEGSADGQIGRCLSSCGIGGSFARGLGIDDDGQVWLSDTVNHRIQGFDADGQHFVSFGSEGLGDGQLRAPTDVMVNRAGEVLVADQFNRRVVVYDQS